VPAKASDITAALMRFVQIFIGQKFYAYEFFVRARFAKMFRRCSEFSALLSVRRKKKNETAAWVRLGESPLRREKLLLCRPASRLRWLTVRQ
jgi:hypothetical protein